MPSLIVATYGGGTALATQRECLEMMDCYGNGQAKKLAEIAPPPLVTVRAGKSNFMTVHTCKTIPLSYLIMHNTHL